MTPDPQRQLILLRHAKSDWPEGTDDLDRPLAERGIADARAAGVQLAAAGVPDLVLCSPARRTRQTWQVAAQAVESAPEPGFEPVIYGASVEELIDLLRTVPPRTMTVLVVGHEPTMSTTTLALAGPGSSAEAVARVRFKYPTAGMARLHLTTGWSDLAPATAVLTSIVVPRG